MAERKDRMALLSRYSKYHTARYESKPMLNLNVEQWAADALLESFSYEDIVKSMDYYFVINGSPTWKGFANNVDRLIKAKNEKEEDDIDGILNTFAELIVYKCIDIMDLKGHNTDTILCRYFGIEE